VTAYLDEFGEWWNDESTLTFCGTTCAKAWSGNAGDQFAPAENTARNGERVLNALNAISLVFVGFGGPEQSVSNSVPKVLARVIRGKGTYRALGPPGRSDVFVTAAEDIAHLSPSELAKRLGIAPSDTFTIIRFEVPETGLASPILRSDPLFIGGGRTVGGAREFVIPNGPLPPNASIEVIGP
jgi:hypothetical protein